MSWIGCWNRTIGKLLFLVPESWRWMGARFIAFLWWDVLRLRRFTLLRNVTTVFPKKSKEERIQIVKEGLIHLGYNFLEVLVIPHMNEKFMKDRIVFHGLENLHEARKINKGVLALCLHIGNGDVSASAIHGLGIPVSIISKRFKAKFWDDLWFGLRGAHGVRYIEAHGSKTAFEILKGLKAGGVVAFVVDQFMGRPFGIESTFFGKKTGTAYGLALFALKTGAPVVPIWTWREPPGGKIHVCFESAVAMDISDRAKEDRDLQMLEMTERYNRVLEMIITQRPEQWMWVHRRWKRWE